MLDRIHRILVPVGFDAFSEEELRTADTLAGMYNAEIHAFHAFQDVFKVLSMRTLDLNMQQIEDSVHEEAATRLRELIESLQLRAPVVQAVRKGDVVEEILDYTRRENIDLIVIGTHGRAGIEHFFLGSVTQKIIRYAGCPVLTLRAQIAPGGSD